MVPAIRVRFPVDTPKRKSPEGDFLVRESGFLVIPLQYLLKHAQTAYVIRSLYDYERKDVREAVRAQLEAQAKNGIRSYVISPKLPHMKPERVAHNTERNITRRVVPAEKLELPSQVMVYNDTVSITSFKSDIVTTAIENKDIADTFKKLFDYLWSTE